MRFWAALSMAEGLDKVISKVPYNLSHSMILRSLGEVLHSTIHATSPVIFTLIIGEILVLGRWVFFCVCLFFCF